MATRDIEYRDGDLVCNGYFAANDKQGGKRPGVIIVHEAWGLGDAVKRRAQMLADLGYAALAVDMFGGRKLYSKLEEVGPILGDLLGNPAKIRARAMAAVNTLSSQPEVDASRLFAIGYCFGGSTVLELARAGAPLLGVVSFHGALGTAKPAVRGEVKASVLVCTGADDAMIPTDHRSTLEAELTAAGVDWQVIAYGNTVHSFTNPDADGSVMPMIKYQADSDRRSWALMQSFFNDRLLAGR